jgi:hypothetical protein
MKQRVRAQGMRVGNLLEDDQIIKDTMEYIEKNEPLHVK